MSAMTTPNNSAEQIRLECKACELCLEEPCRPGTKDYCTQCQKIEALIQSERTKAAVEARIDERKLFSKALYAYAFSVPQAAAILSELPRLKALKGKTEEI